MAISLSTKKEAILTWIARETGLASGVIHWGFDRLDLSVVPGDDYITLSLGPIVKKGIPYTWTTLNTTGEAGKEIVLTSCCDQQTSLHIQAFSTDSAEDVLLGLRDSLCFDETIWPLIDAGVSIFDPGDIVSLPAIMDSEYKDRAAMDCRAYLNISSTRYTGYIETIVGSGIIIQEDTTTEVQVPFVASGIISS